MVAALLQGLIDLLTGSLWTYPLLLGICAGDALIPAFPSETALIVCGIQAARGELSLEWVIVFAAAGAFSGDNASYAVGRWLGRPVVKRFFAGEVAQRRLDWARNFLKERGSYVLVVARFIPGGRTATTFTAGLVHMRWPTRFAPYVFVAAILWAVYGGLLGYLGGRLFEDQPIYALLVALGIATLITVGVEAWRRFRK
jgi:membrane-associated protein